VGLGHPRAVLPLLGREYAREEALPLALEDPANTANLDDVRAEADKDPSRWKIEVHGFMRALISRTASSMPVNSARLRMLWPMFSSCRCGRVRTSAMFT